ncbi:hypothetical protein H257_16163 [Aphanomyces astaci]|uniref:Endonuclease/exonuclease/phosphatase domain-containing protein n=1 Tax=Aphanomyces astaci TaxID=112090 RepID=W4FJL4_APHAT|nr:hypothetical protein H257_16163 [Aphanomyces astaci]ETV67697.1 hypothetical protein H257_16163 [Aphanomyces astaci]|eukprot:XP_009842818.1 hypothetical protein H257_16163 [Aphanomyces astaci]
MTELDVAYKYMVVNTHWQETPVYFHCVYAPVQPTERVAFYDSLPRDFPEDSIHVVMGDLNLPFDLYLDVDKPHHVHTVGRINCLEWLAALRVTDAWRMHHDEDRTYSGPHKTTRLDYILADTHLVRDCYVSSDYKRPDAHVAGDHAIHTLVREAIATEASRLLVVLRDAQNPGVVWHAWKKRTRRFLQEAHRHVKPHFLREKTASAVRLAEARRLHSEGLSNLEDIEEEEKLFLESEDLWKLYFSDLNFDVHASKNERSTTHFFRPPTKVLYKTPVRSVRQRDGTLLSAPDIIQKEFVAHWTGVMREDDPTPPNRATRRRFLRVLRRKLTVEDKNALEENVTGTDLQTSIETMAPHRTPGPDGFSACFYQVAPAVFGPKDLKEIRGRKLRQCFRRRAMRSIPLPTPRPLPWTYVYP